MIKLFARLYLASRNIKCNGFFNCLQRLEINSRRLEEFWQTGSIVLAGGHLALFVAFSFYTFFRNIGWLFPGGDGAYPLHLLESQRTWSSFSFGLSWNPLQGLGDIGFPLNTWLIPGYALPAMVFGLDSATTPLFQVTSHVIFGLELFVATLFMARTFGVGWCASISAAWISPLLMLPYFEVPLLYPLLLLSPQVATIIADLLFVVALFAWLGNQDAPRIHASSRDSLLVVLILILLVHVTLLSPTGVVIFAPIVSICFLGLMLGADKKEFVAKVKGVGLFTLGLAALGLCFYVFGIFDYTVPHLLDNRLELIAMKRDWPAVSNWFYPPAADFGRYLIPVSGMGVLLAIAVGEKNLRSLSFLTAAIMVAIFGLGTIAVETGKWRLPSLIYYEIFVIPIYVTFATYGIFLTIRLFADIATKPLYTSFSGRVAASVVTLLVLIAPIIAVTYANKIKTVTRVWGPLPPNNAPIVTMLKDRIGLVPGEPFRGRVVTMLKVNSSSPIGWMDLIAPAVHLINTTGNDHYWSGLWPNQIPTLFKYNPLMSPSFFLTVLHLLGQPEDPQMRNVIVLRRPDPHALGLLGVRYVIADAPLPSPFQLVLTEKSDGSYTIYLYEVPDVNLGGYSPEKIVLANSYVEALDQLANSAFNPASEVILFESMPTGYQGALSPTNNIILKTIRGGLEIEARSNGKSMVLLPFEFSRCLTIESEVEDTTAPQLVRANAVLTGVLFQTHLKAKISYYTGPFRGSMCRIQDARDFRQLAH